MTDQGIKSRPIYERLKIDPTGLRHLLLTDAPAFLSDPFVADASELEVWSVASRESEGITATPALEQSRSFRSVQQMIDRLVHRLKHEHMGLRLYAAGQEHFLWDVYGVAQQVGMGKHEVFLTHFGSKARRVQCVHCRTFNEGVTTTIVRCDGCGANLFVRDHFSRRLSAFMGVKVDAEVPGDVPSAEQAYL
ncbi:dimethylamine monooxygenase subunit DmmA family protein [Methylobacterium fujisawaense]|uniref:dimethylamine monooxygenase subunit DmmA family protein n=1 Tax=Methylobacterium fujisawaense TaxID=107400 RepID=UPI00313AE63E